jgi:hypothetical protein
MTVKFHKTNTNFQIAHFLAGACHTPDAAYFQLVELKEDRERAINNYNVIQLRNTARKAKANSFLIGTNEIHKLEAKAELLEILQSEKFDKILYEAALDETKFIDHCISVIKPLRQYSDLTDIEANEASQREEWMFELIARAENFMLTSGTIPAGEFVTMRMHPDFKKNILPIIKQLQLSILTEDGRKRFETELQGSKFNLLKGRV